MDTQKWAHDGFGGDPTVKFLQSIGDEPIGWTHRVEGHALHVYTFVLRSGRTADVVILKNQSPKDPWLQYVEGTPKMAA